MNHLKKLREKLSEKAGFTLVELIVVIAILGILAAVAVPTYTGYIARAHQAADLQVLSNVATAVVGMEAANGNDVETIVVQKSDGTITIDPTSTNSSTGAPTGGTTADADVYDLIGADNGVALASMFNANTTWGYAVMAGGEWTLYPTA